MFKITKNDINQIIHIMLKHQCKCSMQTISRHYDYYGEEKYKRKKIREIFKKIENNGTIRIEVKYTKSNVELIFV